MQTQYAQPQNGSVQNGKLSNPATPHIYVEDFLDPAKHDALFAACARLQYREMRGAFGKFKRHQTVAFSSVQVISFYDKRPCLPLCSAPLPIQDLAVSLSAYADKEITYLSVVRYLDGNDYFRFHQHREDKDAR